MCDYRRERRLLIFLLPFLLASRMSTAFSFGPSAAGGRRHPLLNKRQRSSSTRFYAKRNAAVPPQNEFSRTLRPERILKQSGSQTQRGYETTVTAEPSECEALATRFDLSEISSLAADLSLRPTHQRSTSVQVEGTCRATVTQRCVRTNEDFQVNLEFPLFCVVRPVVPLSEQLPGDIREEKYRKTEPRGGQTTSYRPDSTNLDEMDVLELQKMLQMDLSEEEDVLVEDESIYATDGLLDVGELVAQLFWLELDPYPKKPGTGPIQRSITG